MSVNFADYPIHLREGMKLDREYVQLQSQKDWDADPKVFRRNTLEYKADGTPLTKEEFFKGIFRKSRQKKLKNWRTVFIRRRTPI